MRTETITIYSYSELSEEAKATAYKAWEPDYAFFEPTGFYLDDVILGPAKQPTEGKVFGNVIEECLEAFFSACCQDVEYTQSQEYFADFAENNELEFYENDICIRHR